MKAVKKCEMCGTEKPDNEMAQMTFRGAEKDEYGEPRFCSIECMIRWFEEDTKRMQEEAR